MTITQVVDLAQRVHDAEGMDFGSRTTREQRNAQFARIIGIVHHGHPVYNPTPDPQWHLKDAGGGRPQSDESTATLPSRLSYDCIVGCGSNGYWFNRTPGGDHIGTEQNIYPPPVPDGGGGLPLPVPPALEGHWLPAHTSVLARLLTHLGVPRTDHDQLFVVRTAQQFTYSFPGEGWGCKKTGGPISDNVFARQVGDRLIGFKIVPYPAGAPTPLDLTGQTFVTVEAVNHLPAAAPVPVPAPAPAPVPVPPQPQPIPPPTQDLGALLVRVDTLTQAVVELKTQLHQQTAVIVAAQEAAVAAVQGQQYIGQVKAGFLGTVQVRLTPVRDGQ